MTAKRQQRAELACEPELSESEELPSYAGGDGGGDAGGGGDGGGGDADGGGDGDGGGGGDGGGDGPGWSGL